jgi:D-amino-acid dehydrogenase
MPKKVTIVGGGIIGITTAYYLVKAGCEVMIIDKGNGEEGCSYGNAGYISPSHFVPLASPGIVAEGIKYMLDSKSPFYIKPRLNIALIKWCWSFYKSATEKTVAKNINHMNSILQLSRNETIKMAGELGNPFDLQEDGCIMMFRKTETAHHEEELAHQAAKFGIQTKVLDQSELATWEPDVLPNSTGGVFYSTDSHIDPKKYMHFMQEYLKKNGAIFYYNTDVMGFKNNENSVTHILTNKGYFPCEKLVLATGSWIPSLSRDLGINLLLQAGKGFSITYKNVKNNIKRPAILVDDRVALTPLGNDLRVGGTMEISGLNHDISMSRVEGIIEAVNRNFTNLQLEVPKKEDVWAGLRPCTPDGMPYISKTKFQNLVISGGHAMLGISMSAATGLLTKELVLNEKPTISVDAFNINRFD